MKSCYLSVCLLLLLLPYAVLSQNQKPSKKQVAKCFKESIRNKDYQSWDEWSGYWQTNNKDSLFYKNDTVVFVNSIGFNRAFCEVIEWKFYEKKQFTLTHINTCHEPPFVKIFNPVEAGNFKISLIESNKEVFIDVINFKNEHVFFKVISLELKPDKRILKLNKVSQIPANKNSSSL